VKNIENFKKFKNPPKVIRIAWGAPPEVALVPYGTLVFIGTFLYPP